METGKTKPGRGRGGIGVASLVASRHALVGALVMLCLMIEAAPGEGEKAALGTSGGVVRSMTGRAGEGAGGARSCEQAAAMKLSVSRVGVKSESGVAGGEAVEAGV